MYPTRLHNIQTWVPLLPRRKRNAITARECQPGLWIIRPTMCPGNPTFRLISWTLLDLANRTTTELDAVTTLVQRTRPDLSAIIAPFSDHNPLSIHSNEPAVRNGGASQALSIQKRATEITRGIRSALQTPVRQIAFAFYGGADSRKKTANNTISPERVV